MQVWKIKPSGFGGKKEVKIKPFLLKRRCDEHVNSFTDAFSSDFCHLHTAYVLFYFPQWLTAPIPGYQLIPYGRVKSSSGISPSALWCHTTAIPGITSLGRLF